MDEDKKVSKAQAEDTISRDFMLFTLAGTVIVGVFILLVLRVDVPDWLSMIVVTIAASFFGTRIERLK